MSGVARIMLARGIAGHRQRRQGRPGPGGAARRAGATVHVGPRRRRTSARRRHGRRVDRRSATTTPSSPPPATAACRVLHRVAGARRADGAAGGRSPWPAPTARRRRPRCSPSRCSAAGADPSFAIGGELAELGTNAARRQPATSSSPRPTRATARSSSTAPTSRSSPTSSPTTSTTTARRGGRGRLRRVRRTGPARRAARRLRATTPASAPARRARAPRPARVLHLRRRRRTPTCGSASCAPDGLGARRCSCTTAVERGARARACPGGHNALNAAAALRRRPSRAGRADAGRCSPALAGFTGTRRRFEPQGRGRRRRVVDDYAHHPGKVAARRRRPPARSPAAAAGCVVGLPAAPVQPDPRLRGRVRPRPRPRPTRSSSWTSTAPARTRCPASPARWSPTRRAAARARSRFVPSLVAPSPAPSRPRPAPATSCSRSVPAT